MTSTPCSSPPGHRRRTAAIRAAAVLFGAALAACADPTAPVQRPSWDAAQDQIVFIIAELTTGPGILLSDIYRMNADGTRPWRLTGRSGEYGGLQLSPDGTRIAYWSDQSGCYDIWVMDTDGSNATQLTGLSGGERCNEDPMWSPDGSKIAFISSRNVGYGWDTYVMNADGSGVVNVSNNPSTDPSTAQDYVVGWSRDGRVVMKSNRDSTWRTYLVNADGSGVQPLFDQPYATPWWSPDGARVVAALGSAVYVLNADGTGALNVSGDLSCDGHSLSRADPWSPDGSRIVFEAADFNLYVVNADGTGLTSLGGPGNFLGWAPDGQHLLLGKGWDIYLENADGTRAVNLTNDPRHDDVREAIWVPKR